MLLVFDNKQSEIMTQEEMKCEEHFLKNHQRIFDRKVERFKICLPLKMPHDQLEVNQNQKHSNGLML